MRCWSIPFLVTSALLAVPHSLPAAVEGAERIDARTLKGIVVDDAAAEREGFDAVSTVGPPYVNEGYRHDDGKDHGKQSARYRPRLPQSGKYEVRLSYAPDANRATNVPVTIVHAGGKTTVMVNQRKTPPIDGAFLSLGTFRFKKGTSGHVEITNAVANGHVVIDAVQWLLVKE
jgi:hypothetical protein